MFLWSKTILQHLYPSFQSSAPPNVPMSDREGSTGWAIWCGRVGRVFLKGSHLAYLSIKKWRWLFWWAGVAILDNDYVLLRCDIIVGYRIHVSAMSYKGWILIATCLRLISIATMYNQMRYGIANLRLTRGLAIDLDQSQLFVIKDRGLVCMRSWKYRNISHLYSCWLCFCSSFCLAVR